jgi:lipoate-protein ligase B
MSDGLEGKMKDCWVVDLGTRDYGEALALQKQLVAARIKGTVPDVLLLLEHTPSITMGVDGREDMLRFSRSVLKKKGISVHKDDPELSRGGKVTYHGPGQVVGYPIILGVKRDYASFIRGLEETMLKTAVAYGIADAHIKHETDKKGEHLRGTWCSWDGERRKLASRGIGIKYTDGQHTAFVTFHGFAFNVNTDLKHFDYIDPCGMRSEKMTSLQQMLDRSVDVNEVKRKITELFGNALEYRMQPATYEALQELMKHEKLFQTQQ